MIITKRVIEKLKQRDEQTFNNIYYEFEGLVYYICYSITLNKEASEDLMQDTFIKLINSLDTYQENGHFKQYIMQIARNLSKNYVTRIQNKEVHEDLDLAINLKATSDYDNNKLILELQGLLLENEANIVILKIIYNFTFKEIAEDINLTIGEVQAIYYRAIDKVRKAYNEADRI